MQANSSDVVILRNLHVRGDGTTNGSGAVGIALNSGALLSIEGCTISGAGAIGINAVPAGNVGSTLNVINTTITDVGNGIGFGPTAGAAVFGEADHVTIQRARGISSNGIIANGNVVFTVTNSSVLNAQGIGINAQPGAVVNVDSSSVSSNNTAFAAIGGIIRVSRSAIYDNNANFSISGGGQIATDGANVGAINGATMPNGTVSRF